MIQPHHTTNNRIAPVIRILAFALVPGLVLVVLLLTTMAGQPDVVAIASRTSAAITATPNPEPSDSVWLPESTATETQRRPGSATPSTTPPMGVPSTPVSPTALPSAAVSPTVVPATAEAPVVAPATTVLPTSVPIVPTDIPETYASITRIRIPSIGVDAVVEVKSVGSDGVMQTPSAPDVVTWYDFSSLPAGDGNAVFAGHLDYAGYGPAVFWRLGELQPGDVTEVYQQDGTILRYVVTAVRPFAATDDARGVIGSTGRPTITLITCVGVFDGEARSYDQRLVVSGDRID